MSYRSDHDAALARVASLKAENAVLQRKLKAPSRMYTPAVATPDRRRYWPLVALIPAIGLGAAALTSPKPHVHAPAVQSTSDSDLEKCARSLGPKIPPNLEAADPRSANWGAYSRGHAVSKSWPAQTTGCRAEIRSRLDSALISDEERGALEHWRAAEDVLTNEVSLITTYYASHRYDIDDYESVQLWREFDRAYETRQIALNEWRGSR